MSRVQGLNRGPLGVMWIALMAALVLALGPRPATALVPRTVLALYNPAEESDLRFVRAHQYAEMPLNHLGLTVEFADASAPLPAPGTRPDVRGILVWTDLHGLPRADRVVRWLADQVENGTRVALFGLPPSPPGIGDTRTRLLEAVGVRALRARAIPTFRDRIVSSDDALVGFERPLRGPLPRYAPVIATEGGASHLRVESPTAGGMHPRDLVVTGPLGGFVSAAYAVHEGARTGHRQWIINPFEFFRRAYDTDPVPKPDPNTLTGRRIYYSHIDGDGWRNISTVAGYQHSTSMSAKVVLEEAIRPYPDLPVTVAPVTADLEEGWYGSEESRRIARELFALPQVELGSHTHTHPFLWRFFEHYNAAAERPFLDKYRTLNGELKPLHAGWNNVPAKSVDTGLNLLNYSRPRSYGLAPFSLEQEIAGSVRIVESLAPPGRKVTVMQWSGDTSPFEHALAATDAAGLANINGGDTRLDAHYSSYLFVAAVGRKVGARRQIYASASNENTYTNLWTGPYFGFGYVLDTFERTESPIRVKPANIYYHMYSGEKPAALGALVKALDWVRASEVNPVDTSHFVRIAEGFYTTEFIAEGPARWRVRGRGALNTIRFDHLPDSRVDLAASRGVLGDRRYQGSLYVSLDPAVAEPVIALTNQAGSGAALALEESRWSVRALQTLQGGGVSFEADGYGAGQMTWRTSPDRTWRLKTFRNETLATSQVVTAESDGRLRFSLGGNNFLPVRAELTPEG